MYIGDHYEGKCDNCGKQHPELIVQVYKDGGDGVLTPLTWCIQCLHEKR
jgi:hypothetical protein